MASPTKTERVLMAAETEHEGDPNRVYVLSRARAFKHSWVELAEALTRARREGWHLRWGFA